MSSRLRASVHFCGSDLSMRLGGRRAPLVLSLSLLLVAGCTGGKEGGDDSGGDGGTADLVDYLVPDPDGVEGGFPRCLADADAAFQEEYGLVPTLVWVRYKYRVGYGVLEVENCLASVVHSDFPDNYFNVFLYDSSDDGVPDIREEEFDELKCYLDSSDELAAMTATDLRLDIPDLFDILVNDAFPGHDVHTQSVLVASAALHEADCLDVEGMDGVELSLFDDRHPVVRGSVLLTDIEPAQEEWHAVIDGRTGVVIATTQEE